MLAQPWLEHISLLQSHIYEFSSLPSTQLYALEMIKSNTLMPPFCIWARHQSDAIGSRGNRWEEVPNAMTFSFALMLASLPQDLKIQSASIFFGVIMCEFLRSLGSQTWLKYPNDLYIGEGKIGGILTQKIHNTLICGIGINLHSPQHSKYPTLEEPISHKIEARAFLEDFFESFNNFVSWKQIFSIYKLEFNKNNTFFFHLDGKQIALENTTLNEDGSLNINGHKIYSLR